MRRVLLLLLAVLLLLCAAPAALAQVNEEGLDDDPETVTRDPTPEFDGDPESVPAPDPVCERGGADADYAYCAPCPSPDADYQSDGDYAYCPSASGRDEGGGAPRRRAPRALAAGQLPVTGSEPSMLALLGLGLLLAGAGLRLRLDGRRTS